MRQLYLPMRIWDLPTRLFHWAIVVLLFTSWLSAREDWMRLHVWSGLAVLTLLLFRAHLGLYRQRHRAILDFLKNPSEAARHLAHLTRREPDTETGHNAAGGWMVHRFAGDLFVQVGTGLCANDDVLTEGPLGADRRQGRSDWLTHIHHVNFIVIEIAVALHVLAIVTYRVLKGHNLLLPMITGKKRLPGATRAPRMMHPVLAVIVLALCALASSLFLLLLGYSP